MRLTRQIERSSSSKFATLISSQFASSISTSSTNQFENSYFTISKSSFIFFDKNNIISLWKRSIKQITFIKTNKSNFESLKTTSSLLFLNRNSITTLRIFAIFTFFSIQRHTHDTIQLNRCLSFQQLFFFVDDHLMIIASWSSMKRDNVR
jgi:hypothetical protein